MIDALNMTSKKKPYTEVKKEREIRSIVVALMYEIDHQATPLFELWENSNDPRYLVHFNSIRILMPLIETASCIEFSRNPHKLLDKLRVPESKIAWFMFRHGLLHSIWPFEVEKNSSIYTWAIKQYKGAHFIKKDKDGRNIVIISPRTLLNDLKHYLETFKYSDKKILVQTGVCFIGKVKNSSKTSN
jgi:hypothetical protein